MDPSNTAHFSGIWFQMPTLVFSKLACSFSASFLTSRGENSAGFRRWEWEVGGFGASGIGKDAGEEDYDASLPHLTDLLKHCTHGRHAGIRGGRRCDDGHRTHRLSGEKVGAKAFPDTDTSIRTSTIVRYESRPKNA